jgi:tetratricopeptide (TPR) repeat protein
MQTKLGALAAKVSESGWLAALLIVPVLFNIYTERVFEEDKIPLMRSIALFMLVALLIWVFERGREALSENGRPLWKVPLVLPVLALTAAYLVATAFSIVPHISFWGAYIRRQGTYTWLSYMVIFFSILLLVRERKQVERIVTIILLTSVPPTLYGFLQNRNLDPLPWGGDVVERVSSTAGNPIFIGAYLIMVWPLTLMRVIEHFGQLLRPVPEGEEAPNYLASSLLAGAYLFLLIIQTMTIVFSQSRGPWIGWGVGLVFFGVLFALRHSRWLTLAVTILTILGITFLVTFNLPNTPLAALRDVPYIGRLGEIFEVGEGTGRVRVLIWQGVSDLLADNPARDLVGYGPESMYVAYNRFYPPELGQIEARNASPDRSHNETFDSLVMTGLFGFVAQIVVFLSLFYYVLRWLGLINTPGQRNAFVGAALVGGIAAVVLAYLVDGSLRFVGVGLPAGITFGLIVYLLAYALSHLNEVGQRFHTHTLLLIALMAAVLAHFVEIHFGIAVGATRLYFWTYAALAVVIGLPLLRDSDEQPELAPEAVPAAPARRNRREQRRRTSSSGERSLLSGTLVGLSLMAGLLLMVLTFNFYSPNFSLSEKNYSVLWLFLATWLFGGLVVTAESVFEQQSLSPGRELEGRWLQRLGVYAAITLGSWLLFAIVYLPWVNWRPAGNAGGVTPQQLLGYASHLANNMTIVYGFVFGLMLFTAIAFLRGTSASRLSARPDWQMALYAALPLLALPIIINTNLDISRADVLAKQGTNYEREGGWDAARILYEQALQLQPKEDRYFLNLGRAFMERGRTATDPEEREEYLQQAREVLERARNTNPLNTDHTRNLASLHRVWATLATDPAEREAHLEQANDYYEQATTLSPKNAALWNDWAMLHAERGQFEEAFATLDQSLTIDPQWVETYLRRASVNIEREDYEAALTDYDEALEISPRSLQALSGKAFALTQLERIDEAIAVNQQALEVNPEDFTTHKNLALLYERQGEDDLALASAQAAIAVGSPEEQQAMQAFILQLTSDSGSGTPDDAPETSGGSSGTP